VDADGFEDFVSREQPALLRLAVLLAGDRGVGVVPFRERAAAIETVAAEGTVLQSTRPLSYADLGD